MIVKNPPRHLGYSGQVNYTSHCSQFAVLPVFVVPDFCFIKHTQELQPNSIAKRQALLCLGDWLLLLWYPHGLFYLLLVNISYIYVVPYVKDLCTDKLDLHKATVLENRCGHSILYN